MAESIELTVKSSGLRVIVPFNRISSIYENEEGNSFVELFIDENYDSNGFETVESYDEIKKMLAKLVLFSKSN